MYHEFGRRKTPEYPAYYCEDRERERDRAVPLYSEQKFTTTSFTSTDETKLLIDLKF